MWFVVCVPFGVILFIVGLFFYLMRSEERRVGKECRCRWLWVRSKKQIYQYDVGISVGIHQ